MKIFIDSAILEEIELAYSAGIADGVTTNPSLMKKAVEKLQQTGHEIALAEYIDKILRTAKGTPVSIEVTEFSHDKMVEEAKALFERFNPIANNVCIKIPINTKFEASSQDCSHFDGIKAVKLLSNSGIPVNCTLVFTPEQALLAAKAGAAFVSPFAGRVDDFIRDKNKMSYKKSDYFPAGGIRIEDRENTVQDDNEIVSDNGIVSGIDLVKQIVAVFRQYNIKSQVIAASIRNARQAREAALAGADIATLPFSVIQELLYHHKTEEGMQLFAKDSVDEYKKISKI